MNRSVFWISCEFFVLFCLCRCSLADDKVNDTSITKRLGLVNYLFPEPSELLSSLSASNPLSRSSVNGHWVFPQNSRNAFSVASLIPGGTTMDLAESVPRFSYSRFMKDAGSVVGTGSGFNETQATNSSSAYAEYGRRNGGSPGSAISSSNNNQQSNRDSSAGQQRSDGNDEVDIDAELKAADKVVESAIESGNESPSSTPGPLGDGRGFRRPGMRPLRAFRPGFGGPVFDGPYGPYREMRGLSGNGGQFGAIRGLAGGPGLWSPSAYPLTSFPGRSRSPFAMGMKSGLGMNEFGANEGGRGSPLTMNPLLWNEIDALTAGASTGASNSAASFDISAFPLSGISGEGYPLIGGPASLGLFPLTSAASSANAQLHPSASTAHSQVLPSPLQAPGGMGVHGLHGSLPGAGLPGLSGGLTGAPSSPAAHGVPSATGAPGEVSNLADLQKAHPGLHPEQYKYLQQWYSYLNQPSIKSYVDSFRDAEDSSNSASNANGAKSGSSSSPSSSSSSDANKEGNRPWFRNLRLFPNMDMTRLQLPRVRDIFRNIGTRLGSSSASTSTTTESSTDPFNV